MKKNKILIIVSVVLIIIATLTYFIINFFLEKDLENQKKELNKTIEKYGTVEQETIEMLVAKFNTEVVDNGMEYPAREDYYTTNNTEYWYGLYDDIYLFIVPEKYTGNRKKDIVKIAAIYYPKDSPNKELSLKYVKNLLKANQEYLTASDIDKLITKAQELSSKKENAQSKKGIALAYKELDNKATYQVVRINK